MASVSTSIDIGTAPDRVQDRIIDLDRLGEWVTIKEAGASLQKLEQLAGA